VSAGANVKAVQRMLGHKTAAMTLDVYSDTYTDAAPGAPGRVTTCQGPPANLRPVITSLVPSTAAAGEQVTIHGTNFGATQADPNQDYVFFVDGDTSWGAPLEGATFHRDSWSDTAITFTVPTPSGDNGIWHVTPGTTATVPEHVSRALQHRSTADRGIASLVH
jgi:hypothetical protein